MSNLLWSSPALGFLGAHSVEFPSQLREGTDRRPDLMVTLTVPVSLEDIEAVLWWLTEQGIALDELDDPQAAVFYLCDALAHEKSDAFLDARDTIAALPTASTEHRRYQRVRAIVTGLIGPDVLASRRHDARPTPPATAAAVAGSVELAGVAR
jgi:hypothetical protein